MHKTLSGNICIDTHFNTIVELHIRKNKAVIHVPSFLQVDLHTIIFQQTMSIELPNYRAISEFKANIQNTFKTDKLLITLYMNQSIRFFMIITTPYLQVIEVLIKQFPKIKKVFYWDSMNKDIEDYLTTCKSCLKNKAPQDDLWKKSSLIL